MDWNAEHPNIWNFIDALKNEDNLNVFKREHCISGQLPPLIGNKKIPRTESKLLLPIFLTGQVYKIGKSHGSQFTGTNFMFQRLNDNKKNLNKTK